MRGTDESSNEVRVTSAWDVFRARRAPHPPNPLRYAHNFRYAIAVGALAIALTIAVIPARSVENDMLADTRQAKLDGFPDLPPGNALDSQISNWITEWSGHGRPLPSFDEISRLSERVGDYQDDTAILNLGVMGSLATLVLLAAIAFGRALNNLHSLGYGASVLSPTWVFVSWVLPVLSFVIPWRNVSEVFQCAWTRPGEDSARTPRWPMIVAALWGLVFIGLWVFNPVSLTLFWPRDDIDQWITHIRWTSAMLAWLPVPAFFTAAMLWVVALRQHARYRELDRLAAAR